MLGGAQALRARRGRAVNTCAGLLLGLESRIARRRNVRTFCASFGATTCCAILAWPRNLQCVGRSYTTDATVRGCGHPRWPGTRVRLVHASGVCRVIRMCTACFVPARIKCACTSASRDASRLRCRPCATRYSTCQARWARAAATCDICLRIGQFRFR